MVAEGQVLTNSPAVLMWFGQMLWVRLLMNHILNIQMKMCSSGKLHLSGYLERSDLGILWIYTEHLVNLNIFCKYKWFPQASVNISLLIVYKKRNESVALSLALLTAVCSGLFKH